MSTKHLTSVFLYPILDSNSFGNPKKYNPAKLTLEVKDVLHIN